MELNEFRSFIIESGLDVWTWIDMSISVACADHENELKNRRDGIVRKLYAPSFSRCRNCDNQFSKGLKCDFSEVEGNDEECPQKKDEEEDDDGDDEQKQILQIKTFLDDENQSEPRLIELLQRLVGMKTTFQTLKDTDIGRQVSKLRKHSSNEVRRVVKILVRKWKEIVDEWVRLNTPLDEATQFNDDKTWPEEARHGSNADAIKSPVSCYSSPPKEKLKYNKIGSEKLGSPKKPLHYHQTSQETHHAKKQRTEIRDFPKPKQKNAVLSNNGGSVPVRNW